MACALTFQVSDKNTNLPKKSGLFAALSDLSMACLSYGQVSGFSVNRRTIEKYKNISGLTYCI